MTKIAEWWRNVRDRRRYDLVMTPDDLEPAQNLMAKLAGIRHFFSDALAADCTLSCSKLDLHYIWERVQFLKA